MKRNVIECADSLTYAKSLPDCSVHCVVTSPPYYGLRDYSTGKREGGDPNCDHSTQPESQLNAGASSIIPHTGPETKRARQAGEHKVCRKCGAVRIDQQIGLEETPQEYIAKLVELFREYRRVLRDDGTFWLNMGDSYSGSWGNYMPTGKGGQRAKTKERWDRPAYEGAEDKRPPASYKLPGFKPKDLMMIPARLAIALCDDGWYLRSDIIWAKKNCMPESVTDRPTTAHEHIFLLTKSPKYFYDREAVRESQTGNTHSRGNGSSPKEIPQHDGMIKSNHSFNSSMTAYTEVPGGRNLRSVWTIATEPTPFAHFATFPQKLVERCILAGCPHKTCAVCGAPWVRIIEKGFTNHGGQTESSYENGTTANRLAKLRQAARSNGGEYTNQTKTVGWSPTCECSPGIATEPGVVLDPFMGSGTVALVARRLGRDFIGCDLNPEYVKMANGRLDAPYTLPMVEVLQG